MNKLLIPEIIGGGYKIRTSNSISRKEDAIN